MIDLIASASIGGLIGFGICAVLTMGKVGDISTYADNAQRRYGELSASSDALVADTQKLLGERQELRAAHTRCSDALETARNRIERALTCETPKAAHGVRKMARILRGEQGA